MNPRSKGEGKKVKGCCLHPSRIRSFLQSRGQLGPVPLITTQERSPDDQQRGRHHQNGGTWLSSWGPLRARTFSLSKPGESGLKIVHVQRTVSAAPENPRALRSLKPSSPKVAMIVKAHPHACAPGRPTGSALLTRAVSGWVDVPPSGFSFSASRTTLVSFTGAGIVFSTVCSGSRTWA